MATHPAELVSKSSWQVFSASQVFRRLDGTIFGDHVQFANIVYGDKGRSQYVEQQLESGLLEVASVSRGGGQLSIEAGFCGHVGIHGYRGLSFADIHWLRPRERGSYLILDPTATLVGLGGTFLQHLFNVADAINFIQQWHGLDSFEVFEQQSTHGMSEL